jgi:hypothetical protein
LKNVKKRSKPSTQRYTNYFTHQLRRQRRLRTLKKLLKVESRKRKLDLRQRLTKRLGLSSFTVEAKR